MNRFIERHQLLYPQLSRVSQSTSNYSSSRRSSLSSRSRDAQRLSAPKLGRTITFAANASPGTDVIPTEDNLSDLDWYLPEVLVPNTDSSTLSRSTSQTTGVWAEDAVSPDYRHLGEAGLSSVFELTGNTVRELARLNRFDVSTGQDEVLFGLRGCRLMTGTSTALVDSVQLSEDQPDHRGLHCIVGVWKRSNNKIAVFQGSTVPNWVHMRRQQRQGGQHANMLLTGLYNYTVNRHRVVIGAFKQQPNVIVLRSNDDLSYETTDLFERHSPADNIHPAFFPRDAAFSSAGCQTVPGNYTDNAHRGAWSRFRAAAGLGADPRSGWGNRYQYMLLTGREARLVADQQDIELSRLRFGSSGADVAALQQSLKSLGLYNGAIDSSIGSETSWAYIRWQQQNDNQTADAIVTPALGLRHGFDMVNQQSVAAAATAFNVRGPRRSRGFGSPADGSPFLDQAVEQVWQATQQHRRSAEQASSINRQVSSRISGESGVSTDANPYFGLTELEIEAVVRAGYTSRQMPAVLLACWAKEGSTRSVTSWRAVSGASSAANAKTMFRNEVYYQDLGADLFMDTSRPGNTGDNLLSNSNADAAAHESSFRSAVASLVRTGTLSQDISGQINAELNIRGSAATGFSIKPTAKFYALSLLLVDAEFSRLSMQEFPQLSASTPAMTYIHWNTGTGSFRTFLESAERHRLEPEYGTSGTPPTIEHWALRTQPKSNEWQQLRTNAVRFDFYRECYEPLFANALRLIKPGIEDLVAPGNTG